MVFNLTDDEINKIVGEYGLELVDKTLDILKCCTNKEESCETCPLSDFQQCATICDIMALKVINGLLAENKRLSDICESYALQYGTATDKEVFSKKERYGTLLHVKDLLEQVIHAELDLLSDN